MVAHIHFSFLFAVPQVFGLRWITMVFICLVISAVFMFMWAALPAANVFFPPLWVALVVVMVISISYWVDKQERLWFKESGMLQAEQEINGQYEAFWRTSDAERHDSDLLAAKARTALEIRKRLTAFIFHEIRNPLNAMAGAVQMIAGSVKVAQEQKWALIALNSMGMVSNVLNDVLFLTKIEEGRVVMHKQTFSVLGMAEEMRFMFSEQAKQNNLELRVLPPQGVHDFVVGDKNRLNEVLANFCSNAIKFTSTGSVTLEVKQEAEDDKHVDLVIQVTDTGRGLSSDDVVNLFEPFRTLADSRSRTMGANAKGTGLGLVICKHIIRAHGGEVFVHSAGAGKGSTFGFKIMLEKGNPDEALKSSWHIPDASSGVDQYGEPDPQPTDLDESPQIGDRHKRTPSEDFYSWREFNADAPSPREPELKPEQPEPEVLRTPLAKCGGSLRGLSSWNRVHVARTRTTGA